MGADADGARAEARRLARAALARGFASELGGAAAGAGDALDPDAPKLPAALRRARGLNVTAKPTKRKGRHLVALPGGLRPAAAGVLGSVKGLDTLTPCMYIDFPEGRLKLSGARVHPNARYASLKVGRNDVAVEDVFDSLVAFSEWAWVGTKEDNPEEHRLDVPAGVLAARPHGEEAGVAADDFFLSQQSQGAGGGSQTLPSQTLPSQTPRGDSDAPGGGAAEDDAQATSPLKPAPPPAGARRSSREHKRVKYAELDDDADDDYDMVDLLDESD